MRKASKLRRYMYMYTARVACYSVSKFKTPKIRADSASPSSVRGGKKRKRRKKREKGGEKEMCNKNFSLSRVADENSRRSNATRLRAIVEVSARRRRIRLDSQIDGREEDENRKSSIIYVSGTLKRSSHARARDPLVIGGLLNSPLRNIERERVRESRVERGIYSISGQCP